jgi:hypothetical protein
MTMAEIETFVQNNPKGKCQHILPRWWGHARRRARENDLRKDTEVNVDQNPIDLPEDFVPHLYG